jgi:hypothetical protein
MEATINIGGQDRKFAFGLGYFGEMLEILGVGFIEFDELQSKNPFKYTPIKMACSFNYANETDISSKEVLKWLNDDIHHPAISEFNKHYIDSLVKNVPVTEKKTKVRQVK